MITTMITSISNRVDLSSFAFEGAARGVKFRCHPGNYAKGKMSLWLEKEKPDGFKGAADRLAEALNAKWNGRSGYVIAPSRATLWRKLFVAGWDADMDWRGSAYGTSEGPLLESPDGRRVTLQVAAKEFNQQRSP